MTRNRNAQLPHHEDVGCDLYGTCMTCPFVTCYYDIPFGWRARVHVQGETMTCAKCGGSLRYEASLDGSVIKCLTCGQETPAHEGERMTAAKPTAHPDAADVVPVARKAGVTLTTVVTADWIKAAKDELARALAAVAAADKYKAEAERIHAALSAYGVDLQPLPWESRLSRVRAQGPTGPGSRGPYKREPCSRCGTLRALQGQGFRKTADGLRLCRNTAECDAAYEAQLPQVKEG